MDTLDKIRNTMQSIDGQMKVLEHDPNLDLATFCDRASALEHKFYCAVKNILANDKNSKENVSSVTVALCFGMIDEKKVINK